ncbi:MAG TPA: hypothetical protein VIH89_01840 [Candidatus Sulfotelmatobacter sp.]
MSEKSNQPRTTARINSKLEKKLAAYMAAAGAAGVGFLGISQPAEAKVVYTPANTSVQSSLAIDLNHDGTTDFTVGLFPGYYHTQLLDVTPTLKGNAIDLGPGFFGVPVGPAAKFATNSYFGHGVNMAGFFGYGGQSNFFGPWAGAKNRYLGFKFLIDGQIHYGWARFSVPSIEGAVLTGYAYETVANKPIIEGHTSGPESIGSVEMPDRFSAPAQPEGLGMLARGADGLAIWRRNEESAAQ